MAREATRYDRYMVNVLKTKTRSLCLMSWRRGSQQSDTKGMVKGTNHENNPSRSILNGRERCGMGGIKAREEEIIVTEA